MVLVNVARALAAPITLEPDHNDVLAARDSGYLQFHAETCQEILDLIILAYRIAEDRSVMLPAIVNMDGFYLSFTREQVELPDQRLVNEFLPEYKPENPFRATRPVAKGAIVVGGSVYSYFRYHIHAASMRAAGLLKKAGTEYEEFFGRRYEAVEPYMLDDADYVLVMSNSFATIGKQAVRRMRAKGVHAGLLKLRMLRPFPVDEILDYLTNRKAVAVLDQNMAPGSGGIIYPEIAATLYHDPNRPEFILPVVGGLGGKRLSQQEMDSIFERMRTINRESKKVRPLLLMTEDELESVKKELAVAGLEKEVSG
jgi:pyruvate ferredoxin oxidoreductase alpha subunit